MKTIAERIQIVANKLNTTYGHVKLMIYSNYGTDTISPENKLLTLEKRLGINKEDKALRMFNIGETVIIKRRKDINPKRILGKIIGTTNINRKFQYIVKENNSIHYCDPETLLKI